MSYVSLFPNFSLFKNAWEDQGLILVLKVATYPTTSRDKNLLFFVSDPIF